MRRLPVVTKAGGFFGGFALNASELDPYLEETVWSYEAGLKTQITSNFTFNGALYYYDYQKCAGLPYRAQYAVEPDPDEDRQYW